MNKTAIKNFAIWARRKLISDITYKAGMMGITENGIAEPLSQSTRDLQFFDIGTKDYAEVSGIAIDQRNALIKAIQHKEQSTDYKTAFRNVVEEVAYTWFNRLIAVRFMEINDYLPSRVRVLSSESEGKLEPDFVTTPFETDLDFSPAEREQVLLLKDNNKLDELFRMLFIKQCNKLSEILPGLFEKISDYTEVLLNISFTDKDGIVFHLTHDISEDEFNVEKEGQVEIIGWMYQYYNTEPKDEAFALLRKNVKITKERIPAATQLFTPDWVVRYMVDNSLGRLWVESHPNDEIKDNWKYYIEDAEQESDVVAQLNKIYAEYAKLNPTDIKVIDPCMGSGHILVYAFDVLMQIYVSQGYTERDAAKSILINNLYGIDIDVRAYQLAYFAVMMKARQYNRRIFNEHITPNLITIRNPENISKSVLKRLGGLEPIGLRLVEDFEDAEEYGSILQVNYTEDELIRLEQKLAEIDKEAQHGDILMQMESAECVELVSPLIMQARLLIQKYEVVVTNPPYMGNIGMNDRLASFVKENYAIGKMDMFSVFMLRVEMMTKTNGYYAMITQPSWLFLASFSLLRSKIVTFNTISSVLHMGRGIFGIDFGSTSFCIRKQYIQNYKGAYFRLHKRTFQYIDPDDICCLFLNAKENHNFSYDFSKYNTTEATINNIEMNTELEGGGLGNIGEQRIYYSVNQEKYSEIPDVPIAYWLNSAIYDAFAASQKTKNDLECIFTSGGRFKTCNDEKYLRLWWEIDYTDPNWHPYCKGGDGRKYVGNEIRVIDWTEKAKTFYNKNGGMSNKEYWGVEGITWSTITINTPSFRIKPSEYFNSSSAPTIYAKDGTNIESVLAYLNSKPAEYILNLLNPTASLTVADVLKLPYSKEWDSEEYVKSYQQCISLTRVDWDSFELSRDFKCHPLAMNTFQRFAHSCEEAYSEFRLEDFSKIENRFRFWEKECQERYSLVKKAEEDLNCYYIDIYKLQDELKPDVTDEDVTVRKSDLGRDIRSFISFAVGCMFGRFSLDTPGLIYAGGVWDVTNYKSFIPDVDNCIPITDDDYFADDIVDRFVEFVRIVFGPDFLEENLGFIAKALGNRGNTSRKVIRNYFLNDFFKDHLKIYQKRPIYWLFDSGKQNGFKALVYMHRWNADTVGNLRVEYLHKMQTVYEHEIETCQDIIDHGTGRDVAVATKRKEKLVKQLKECKDYDSLVAHIALSRIDIDLDDGVKVNYRKVQTGADGKFCEILANSKDIMAKEK